MGKYVIRKTQTGIKFDLKAGNGEVVLTSEVYSSTPACKNGIESVMNNASIAAMEDQTTEGFKVEKNPKFEVYLDKSGEYRFKLTAKNGQTIATGEGYKSKSGCLNGIESIKKNSKDSAIIEENS